MILRPYQTAAIEEIRTHLRAGKQRVVLVAPTGSGKTVLASSMIQTAVQRGKRVIFAAHRKELVTQCSAKLDAFGVDHGIVMADHPRYRPQAPVQVASIQTLIKRLGRVQTPDLIFCDESHHARSQSWHRIIEAFPAASVIGLTATPWRLDGKGLGELFDALVVASTVRALIDLGSLVPAKGFTYEQPDLSGVRKSAGDYNQEQLDAVMAKVILTGHILEEWKAHAAGKRTVVFAVNIRHSQIIVEQFRAAGIPAEHVDAHTPQPIRDAILDRLRSGKTLVVSNVGILTEGWDMPACEVAVLARPTQSISLALQMMGRVLRPWCFDCGDAPRPDCDWHRLKQHARIHDHAGVILAHGQPADPRDYSLDGDKPPKPPPSKQCPACYFVNPAGVNMCGECGYDFAAARQEGQRKNGVIEVSARRIEFDDSKPRPPPGEWTAEERTTLAQATPEQKAGEYLLLEVEARKRGFKKGWIGYRYQEMFGAWPNFTSEFLNSVPMPIEHLVRELERPPGRPCESLDCIVCGKQLVHQPWEKPEACASRKFCNMECKAAYEASKLPPIERRCSSRPCEHCGGPMVCRCGDGKSCAARRFCTTACSNTAGAQARRSTA